MSDLQEAAASFRLALLEREARTVRELAALYHEVLQEIERELQPLLAEIARRQEAGQPVSISMLTRGRRLARLEADIISRLEEVTGKAYETIRNEQSHAVQAGLDAAQEMLDAAMGDLPEGIRVQWAQLNPRAVEAAVGFASDGSPLRTLLDTLPGDAGKAARSALIRGVALGKNPRLIARDLQGALGGNLTRALTIARTETLRAYRTAALQMYQANSNVVAGWVWIAACDRRTCAMCWAMHGSFHPLDDPFASHPACRCSAGPSTRTVSELTGRELPDTRPVIIDGAERFRQAGEAVQREVLGPAAYAAYSDGAIELADLVEEIDDPRWGLTRRRASLASVLGARAAGRYASAAGG